MKDRNFCLISEILVLILVGMSLGSCVLTTGEFEPQVPETNGNSASTSYPAPMPEEQVSEAPEAYPPPNSTSAAPYPSTTEQHSQQVGQETIPWPTFTPIPTPTRQLGPTPTAFPLREPTQSAAGSIIYLEKHGGNLLSPFRITVDELGGAVTLSEPLPMGDTGVDITDPVSVYPSPDGRHIILTSGWGVRYIFNADTGQSRLLFQDMLDPKGQSFNWHPDGKHFLMEAEEGSRETGLWLVDIETGEYSVLLHKFPTPHIIAGDISPNGQNVIYALDTSGTYEVWLADINGNNPQIVWESRTHVGLFAWSPNGRYLAMNGGRIMDMQNHDVKTITNNMAGGYGYAFRPIWSPDSRYIAFIAFDAPNPLIDNTLSPEGFDIDIFKGTNIHILDVTTGEEKILLQEQGTGHIYPTWSPDGSQIAFTSNMSGKSEIWVIDIDGSDLRQLTNSQWPVHLPYWTSTLSNTKEQ